MPRRKPTEPMWTQHKALKREIKRRDKADGWSSKAERDATYSMSLILWMMAVNHPMPKYLRDMLKDCIRKLDVERSKLAR